MNAETTRLTEKAIKKQAPHKHETCYKLYFIDFCLYLISRFKGKTKSTQKIPSSVVIFI